MHEGAIAAFGGKAANAFDQLLFAGNQGESTISKKRA
jgi:hypothetical protein